MNASHSRATCARAADPRRGYTLVEMLVVIGIIGVLGVALLGSFSYLKTTAWQTRAQTQVSHVAAGLTVYLQNERSWPDVLLAKTEFDAEACALLQNAKIVDITTWKDFNSDGTGKTLNENSPDRYGLLDPWGVSIMRKNPLSLEDAVKNHRLQFRLDKNFDGYVDASEGSPNGVKVRGSVLVWSRGPDGYDDDSGKNPKAKHRYPYDDRLSWNYGQAKAENP